MRIVFIAALMAVIGSTGAFAQQQKKSRAAPQPVSAKQQFCPKGYDACVRGGMRMGYSSAEAGGFCTRRCSGS
jgi:hypothetical protein